ncbi:MAG: hypothetical protein ABW211_06095, partial [Acidimicrobiia bacterium]
MANVRRSADTAVALGAALSAARVLRRGWVARYVSRFATIALRRGMSSGSRPWLYAGAAATTLRLAHKYMGRTEEVYHVKLRRGERVEIREIARESG